MASGVYEIRNTTNGKRYIGSAADIESRLRQHRKYLKSKKGHHSRKASAATRAKMSASRIGKKFTDQHRANISAGHQARNRKKD